IPRKGYNRVIIAYEELLPMAQDKAFYRYPLPDCKLTQLDFSLQASAADCREPIFLPKDTKKQEGGGRFHYSRGWQEKAAGGDVVFAFSPAKPQLQAISGRQGESGPLNVYARIRPELKKIEHPQPFAPHAVFLLDTSLSEHPDRFAVNMKLLKKILESDPGIKQFNILTSNVSRAWVEGGAWLPNTEQGRERAFSRLDGILLEGATDVSAALEQLARSTALAEGTPLNVFLLSDGQITWGESEIAS